MQWWRWRIHPHHSLPTQDKILALSCSLAQETLNPCHAQKEGADGGLSGEVQTSVYSGVLHEKCVLQCTKRKIFKGSRLAALDM